MRLILEMKVSFLMLEYLLITVMQPMYQAAASDYCKLDAALSYTGNDKVYFFKGNKYALWKDDDTLDFVGGIVK